MERKLVALAAVLVLSWSIVVPAQAAYIKELTFDDKKATLIAPSITGKYRLEVNNNGPYKVYVYVYAHRYLPDFPFRVSLKPNRTYEVVIERTNMPLKVELEGKKGTGCNASMTIEEYNKSILGMVNPATETV